MEILGIKKGGNEWKGESEGIVEGVENGKKNKGRFLARTKERWNGLVV